jgi:Tfp pilus assembly protein PilF
MDFVHIIVELILGMATTAMGWFAKQLWNKSEKNLELINNIKVDLGTNYVRYDRLHDAMKPIMDALAEIKDTLKTKADK